MHRREPCSVTSAPAYSSYNVLHPTSDSLATNLTLPIQHSTVIHSTYVHALLCALPGPWTTSSHYHNRYG